MTSSESLLVETRTQGNDGSPAQLIRYQFSNHLGSASLELDHSGQIISYEEYYPYGATSYQSVRSQTDTPKSYRYISTERDKESGLTYHGMRYYIPWIGTWLSADPSGTADHLNLYVFSQNNPINFIDLNGRNSEEVEKAEASLIDARARQEKLLKDFEKANITKAEQEAAIGIREKTIDEIKSDLKEPANAGRKAELEASLARNQRKLSRAQQNLNLTKGQLKQINADLKDAKRSIKSLQTKVRKLGGDPTLGPKDTKYGVSDKASLSEVDADDLSKKLKDLEAKEKSSGGGGSTNKKSGPMNRWRVGPGFVAGAKNLVVTVVVSEGPRLVKEGLEKTGVSEEVAEAGGFFAAVAGGAGYGAMIGAPEGGVGAIPGAIIGGGIAAVAYAWDAIFEGPYDPPGYVKEYMARKTEVMQLVQENREEILDAMKRYKNR